MNICDETCWSFFCMHYDVIKWKHFPRNWPFVRRIHRSPVNSPHKGQWRRALMFPLICVWINDWVNNREAGDLRRHLDHYDVSVMENVLIITLIPRQDRRRHFQTHFLRKCFEFLLIFHWSLFPRVQLTIYQRWFRSWLGADQVTSHHLNQWWSGLLTHICVTLPQWVV